MNERPSISPSAVREVPVSRAQVHVVKSVLSGTDIAFKAIEVDSIEDSKTTAARALDMVTFLKLPVPPEDSIRRTLVFRRGATIRRVVVGESVRIEALERGETFEVPALLSILFAHLCVSSLFHTENGIGFVFDIDQLLKSKAWVG